MLRCQKFRIVVTLFLILPCLFETAFGQSEQKVGDLVIISNIKDASIYLDGIETGRKTPTFFRNLSEGEHFVRLVDKYGKQVESKYYVAANKTTPIQLDFKASDLMLTSNFWADSVFVNGVLTEQTIDSTRSATIRKLAEGDYTIRLVESRFGISKEDKIFILADKADSVHIDVEFGHLKIISDTDKASIFINDRATDRIVPALFENLATGVYDIRLEKGFKKTEKTIQLKPGIENIADLQFEKGKKLRYITLGAVTIGASLLTWLLTRDDGASGTSEPGITFPEVPDPGED
ncbi:MAG: PEGA domain-containing protein [Planctomycetes bacterium]|nr:PEGA domain-containing protein [Planctomycetota bacterium]